jgi:2-polyprenyl-6-methoxyphenol hydroxylase-like FAD-dependent oxidoreductase
MAKKSVDVLVIGAGPVGLFCANELARHGLSCRIFDKKTGLSDKSKALGLHIRTLDVMEDCGFIDDILAQGLEVDGILFKSNGRELTRASFVDVEANRHFLIDLPQDKTERILFNGLYSHELDVEWQTELTALTQNPAGVCATFTGEQGEVETVSAPWLIACDGAGSTVRHLLQVEFVGSEYQQNWWLADLLMDWDMPANDMVIYLHQEGPLACFPMGDQRYRLVMTAPKGNEAEPHLDDIIAGFKRRSSDVAALHDPVWITKFRLHHRQIQHYRKEHVFFAGDAAHIHSPMGGQGLNTGIQDAYNLAWKLALVQKKLAQESLLDSYHAERYPVGLDVLKKTDKMTKMILMTNPVMVTLRNLLISTLMSFRSVKNKLATDMAELAISYANSPIVANLGSSNHFKAGYFLCDFNLTDVGSKRSILLHNIIQGTAHHLFLFVGLDSSDMTNLVEIATYINDKFPGVIIPHIIVCAESSDVPGTYWLDTQQEVHRRYAIKQSSALLIRPDKYIALTQSPVEKEALMQYLSSILLQA